MVASELEPIHQRAQRRNARRWALLGTVAGVVAVCAVAVMNTRSNTANLVDKPNELYMDSMKVANKILSAQKFKRANEVERKDVVKSILADGHEHKSGKKVVSKVASIVANNHLSYHQRMEAMKKLLDEQTDAIKQKPLHRVDEPKHAAKKVHSRGRTGHRSKAQVADDNKKAMSEGAKLLAKKVAKSKDEHGHYLHATSKHDKKVHEESEHEAADPAKAAAWMKKQLGEVHSSKKVDKAHVKPVKKESKAKTSKVAKATAALKEGEKLLHETVKHKLSIKHKLHMSRKDEAIKKESEKEAASPKDAHKWISKQLAAHKDKAHVKKLAAAKKSKHAASSHETKSQKLIKWAEAHGMPKKLAENPKDKQKVKDIIARMKADLMVEKIKAQFKHDDDSVGDVIHSADPAAATTGI